MTDSAIETMLNCIDEVPAVKAAFDGMDEAARAELAKLRADREMLEWFMRPVFTHIEWLIIDGECHWLFGNKSYTDIRDAIRAAMKEGKSNE